MNTIDSLMRLAAVIESRKITHGGNPDTSYVARLLHKGPDAFSITTWGLPTSPKNWRAEKAWGAWKKKLCAKPCNETQEKTDVSRTRSRLHFLQNHPRQDSFTQGV